MPSTEEIHLSWVDENDKKLQETAERQIQTTSACHITLKESHLHHKEKTWGFKLTDGWINILTTYTMFGKRVQLLLFQFIMPSVELVPFRACIKLLVKTP